jgi:D-sedoheptulose 7-phosphate isomerase
MSAEVDQAVEICLKAKREKRRFFFIGNGGSAAIASHMAADWLKNGNVAAMAFNDPAMLTCIANDHGYENVFAKPLYLHGSQGDVLFAISSSGESRSITNAVGVAKSHRLNVITLSGFKPDNRLRRMGDVNFYVDSDKYGTVEIAHHTICHGILDRCITS